MSMNNISLNMLINKFDVYDIEHQLILNYIEYHGLNDTINSYFKKYIDDYQVNNELSKCVRLLNHTTIEDIVADMELLIPDNDKKVNGAFFTPSYIVDYIINTIHPQRNDKVIDLSCGSGAFLLGVIKYYMKTYGKTVRDCALENLYGIDILHYNVYRSKLLIQLLALTYHQEIDDKDLKVIQGDSLNRTWKCKFDVIIGNPPYVKFQDMDDITRLQLVKRWSTTKFGTFNLYFAFFELGLNLLSSNGKLGYITPNNYFTSLAGEGLRAFFQNKECIYKIVDFNSTKVFNVQTYTAITFLNKKRNLSIEYGRIGEKEQPRDFLDKVVFTLNSYKDISTKKWRLLCGNERKNIYSIENSGDTLGALFNVCVGIATLKDEVYFILPIGENDKYFFIHRDGVQYEIEKEVTRPLVKISDIKKQSDLSKNERRIIFPYSLKNGKPLIIDERTFQCNYPKCYEYLLSVRDILSKRGKGKHTYVPFYSYGRTQGLARNGIKLLTPTFSKYPRFLLDKDDKGLFTNGYGIYLSMGKKDSLFPSNPLSEPENFDVIQKILNSAVMQYYISKTSVSIEGGYPCYQKNFIEKFSFPHFSDNEILTLKGLNKSKDIDSFLIKKYHLNLSVPNLSI